MMPTGMALHVLAYYFTRVMAIIGIPAMSKPWLPRYLYQNTALGTKPV